MHVMMDFDVGLLKIKLNHDVVLVRVDRLKRSAHFLPRSEKYFYLKIGESIYIREMVVDYGVTYGRVLLVVRSTEDVLEGLVEVPN